MSDRPRVALVTGAGSGIGRAIAARLAADGLAVAVADVRFDAAEETVRLLGSSSEVEARAVGMDVADDGSVGTAVAGIVASFGGLDVLVNNAGVFPGEADLSRTDPGEWELVLRINLTGAYLCARAAVGHLERSRAGRIVNVASRAWLGSARLPAYSASKGGLISLTRSLAMELGPLGVTVNAVSPTTITTPLFDAMDPDERAAVLARVAGQPIPRMGDPADVAAAVAFFVGEDAGYVTGQHLYVGGGTELRGSSII